MPSGADICDSCRGKLTFVKEPYCLKCGKPLGTETELCELCKTKRMYFDEGRALYIYNDVLRKSIYGFKYNNRREYSGFYGAQMAKGLKRKLTEWRADAIIPIPLHKSRMKKRGYNQAALLAHEISKYTKIPVYDEYLIRQKSTVPQKNLDVHARENNLKNAFKIKYNDVQLNSVILIDDIYTTGSTINEAAKCLKDAGVKNVYYAVISCAYSGN